MEYAKLSLQSAGKCPLSPIQRFVLLTRIFLIFFLRLIFFSHFRQTFRFKTRLQCLNSIEASSRAKVNFLEQLYRFHKQQGNPRVSVPTINHKSLDLWLLRKEVHKLGGYDAVCLMPRHTSFPPLTRTIGHKEPEMGRPWGPPRLQGHTRFVHPDQEFIHANHIAI